MRAAARLLGHLLLGLVLALGALSLLAFAAAPLLEHYRDRVADLLSAGLGTPVSIERLEAHWHPFGPQLRLEGVALGRGAETMRLREADLELHWPGLLREAPSLLRLTVRNARVHVAREPTGQVHVLGLPLPDSGPSSEGGFALPVRLRLLGAEILWDDRKHGREPLRLYPVTAQLAGGAHGWVVELGVDSPHGRLAMGATVRGALSGLGWDGAMRLRFEDLDLAALAGDYLPRHYRLAAMRLDADLTSTWLDARPVRVDGELGVRDLRLAGDADVHLDALLADVVFAREDDDWRLELSGVRVTRGERTWPEGRIAAAYDRPADGPPRLEVGADFVRLEDVLAFLAVRAPWTGLEDTVQAMAPRAELRDVRARVAFAGDAPEWRFAGRFDELRVEATADTPGVAGLSGEVRAEPGHVQFDLDSRDTELVFAPLFRDSLTLERLAGRLDWVPGRTGGWTLSSDELRLDTPHLATRSRLRATAEPGASLFLDFQTNFRDGDASHLGRYLPVGIMDEELVSWLDHGIVGGSIVSGTALFHGPVEDFAFGESHTGHFEVLFGVRDVILDYSEGWPRLEEVEAELRFHNNALEILVTSGRVLDSELRDTRAVIGRLDPAAPVEIRGSVHGPLSDELRLLAESPLSEDFGPFVSGLKARGRARLDLDFAVPLDEQGEYRLDGLLHFLDSRLELSDWDLALEDIRGRLGFDLDSLSASGIAARALGTDLSVDVREGPAGGTWVTARGTLGVPEIRRRVPQLPLARADGAAAFEVRVEIPDISAPAGAPTWLVVQSDLEGVAVDLPPPLGKPGELPVPLAVRVPVSGRGGTLAIAYGERVNAALAPDLGRGDIRLGGQQAGDLPERPVLRLGGRLDRLDLSAWLEAGEALSGELASETALPELEAALSFGEVALAGDTLPELSLTLVQRDGDWRGRIESPRLAGDFRVPAEPTRERAFVDLERLYIEADFTAEAAPTAAPPPPIDPRGLPALRLTSQSLRVNEADLGRATLQLARVPGGLRSEVLRLEGGQVTLEGSLDWLSAAAGVRTTTDLGVEAEDLGRLLRELGLTPQLEETALDARVQLAWAHDPLHPSRERLDGKIALELDQGRLLDVDPGVTRVLGILNFAALQRRLRLDFSDLFKKGFSFDRLDGTFTLAGGDAYTNDLRIEGPSGTIDISGRTGLTAQDFDQLVTLTPRPDATLPIAGALAGGPVAGVVVLLAQQLMKEEVDRIYRVQYEVTGPWSNPEITVLDTGGTLSKLLRALSRQRDEQSARPGGPDTGAETASPPGASKNAEQDAVEGSPLERWLQNLEPTGGGMQVLDGVD